MYGSLGTKSKKNKMFNRKLTRTEVALAIALTGAVIYILYYKVTEPGEIVQPAECEKISCYGSIIEIQNFVDSSVNPCEDFHQFACGNFLANAYKKQVQDIINQEGQELSHELDAMIVDPISSTDSEKVATQKMFFRACVNADESDADRKQKVLDLVAQIKGLPLLGEKRNWNEKEFDWVHVMIECKKLGLPFQWFLEFGIHVDEINYLKVSVPTIHQQHQSNAKELLYFEQQLAKVANNYTAKTSLYTVEELQQQHPLFNWIDILTNIIGDAFEITEETVVASNVDDYIRNLYSLLNKNSKQTQANYIKSKIIEHFTPYISYKQVARSELCKEQTRDSFRYLSETEYIRKYSPSKVRESAKELTNLTLQEFVDHIKVLTWWNVTARDFYLEKFYNTEIDIGFDNENLFDDEFLEANYLNFGNLSLFENSSIIDMVAERSKHYYYSLFSNINETGIEPEEKNILLEVANMKIFFHEDMNKMVVPPSMLHGFLYEYDRPHYLNFGTLGYLIAKEFIAIFQTVTQGDENATIVAFQASNKCFEEDYSHIKSEEKINLDGSNVVNEILPDIVARDIAYKAYQSWVQKHENENGLPLLSYSPSQLFWIKSSFMNCYRKLTDVEGETDFDQNVSKYKNILSMRHSRYFGDDFNCPEKTMMNPVKKC